MCDRRHLRYIDKFYDNAIRNRLFINNAKFLGIIWNYTMFRFFDALIDKTGWIISTGWDVWSKLFAQLPYGDPYIATVVAMMVFYWAVKTIYPDYQTYR